MNLFLVQSKLRNIQIRIISPQFNSRLKLSFFPETVLFDKSINSVTCIISLKSKIVQIVTVNLSTGQFIIHKQKNRLDDINSFIDFIDCQIVPNLFKKIHIFFKKINFLKRTVNKMVEKLYFNNKSIKNIILNEIETDYFIIKKISEWPSVNKSMVSTSEYFNLIFNNSLTERILAYMTPLTGPTYVKEINSQNIVKEYIPTSQKLVLSLLYKSGVYRHHLSDKIISYLTVVAGQRFDSRSSALAIKKFIEMYNINMEEYENEEYKSFNDFFIRKLKKGTRRVEKANKITSPADCRILTTLKDKINIKGKFFEVDELLRRKIEHKNICICRLAPQDYHRFHSPLPCSVVSIYHIQGKYHSVNPITKYNKVLDENVRSVIELRTKRGMMYYVAVGAALVGSIVLNIKSGDKLNQMEEMGYFRFGGSCIVLISEFEWQFKDELCVNSCSGIETLVSVGNSLEE